jgi:hypothetical protein
VNDLPLVINNNKNKSMVLYADDSSIIISNSNPSDFNLHSNLLFYNINTWYKNNLLLLNLNKTQHLQFLTKQSVKTKCQIQYNNKYLTTATHIEFLRLIIDSTITWKQHIFLVSKRFSSTCIDLNCIKHSLPKETLK